HVRRHRYRRGRPGGQAEQQLHDRPAEQPHAAVPAGQRRHPARQGTFGVGQPIVVWFDEAIKDKAAAEKSLVVTTTPPGVVGGWYWMDDHEVHWRPKDYWPAGTKVHVEANVYGKDLGNGLYGQEDREATFTIGPSKIAVADSNTHRMKVFIDGK